jgi:cobalt-precorrin 5A hydrolase / precorrin-3B C17-methyltransferase
VNVVTLTVSEPGRRLARALPYPRRHGNPRAELEAAWDSADGIVLVLALGASVRLIAPLLADKRTDPAVVCLDDAGQFAVALCGGHAGGANALAREVAALTGATPVVTTASDVLGVPALDLFEGFVPSGDLAGAGAALLAGSRVRIDNDAAWPLPAKLLALTTDPSRNDAPAAGRVTVRVTDRIVEEEGPRTVTLRPPSLVVGIGTSSHATVETAHEAVATALAAAGMVPASLGCVATIDRRATHPAVTGLAALLGCRIVTFGAEELRALEVPNPSVAVSEAVGSPSVAEAAALAAAGPGGALVATKSTAGPPGEPATVTVALARRAGPQGSLSVVGVGPGDASHRSFAAAAAVRHAQAVVGYRGYVELCEDLLNPTQLVERYELGAELERSQRALELAAEGLTVALVCSGDPGIYAMASPVFELAAADPRLAAVPVTVVPGTSAGQASAALLGAPLGHDHAVISLSDLHTPWERIAARLAAAAAADYVVVLYNPRSKARTWQIEAARALLLSHRSPDTPVGLVTDAGRPGQQVTMTTLGALECDAVTMTTCVVVGCSTTAVLAGRMVTPRGYPT